MAGQYAGARAQYVRVDGLRELRRALKDIGGPPLQKQLRTRFKAVGDEVADEARAKVPVKTGRARASIKSGVSGNQAYVQGGKATVPYYGWLDFGGQLKPVGGRKNTQNRPRPRGGRYLYPTVWAKRGDITAAAVQALEDTKRDLGLR